MPEPDNRSTASELDGLPDVDRKETEEILEEIAKDEGNKEGDQEPKPEDSAKKSDESADNNGKKEDGEGKEEEKDGKGKPDEGKQDDKKQGPRNPRLMPSWVHERAQKEWEKKNSDLQKALDDALKGKGPQSDQQTPEAQEAFEKDVKEAAEKLKLPEETVRVLVELGKKHGGTLPPDVQEALSAVKEFKATQEVAAEESAFNAAFEKEVLPLIKAEYGDLDADTIKEIRDKVMEKAYSDEYGKTPLGVLFKGVDEFRGFKRVSKKSGEESRGGTERVAADGAGGDDSEFENVTDEDIEKMDSGTFDRYTAWAEKREKERRS